MRTAAIIGAAVLGIALVGCEKDGDTNNYYGEQPDYVGENAQAMSTNAPQETNCCGDTTHVTYNGDIEVIITDMGITAGTSVNDSPMLGEMANANSAAVIDEREVTQAGEQGPYGLEVDAAIH
jgi:hypothetical protein